MPENIATILFVVGTIFLMAGLIGYFKEIMNH